MVGVTKVVNVISSRDLCSDNWNKVKHYTTKLSPGHYKNQLSPVDETDSMSCLPIPSKVARTNSPSRLSASCSE